MLLFLWIVLLSGVRARDVSIVISMICRDEGVNFRANLGLWLGIADYFVFAMDERNTDDSASIIESILKGKAAYAIIPHKFDGFGQARTASLEAAWKHFPQASHVLIADPDWRPDVSTFRREELEVRADVYRFLLRDRNGYSIRFDLVCCCNNAFGFDCTVLPLLYCCRVSARTADWLLTHKANLKMRYHLHEVIDIGVYSAQIIHFAVNETYSVGTWHSTVGHGTSNSLNRILFDISMLKTDLETYGHDPRTHLYLGLTNSYALQAAKAEGRAIAKDEFLVPALDMLTRRVTSTYKEEFVDDRWSALLELGILSINNAVNACCCLRLYIHIAHE